LVNDQKTGHRLPVYGPRKREGNLFPRGRGGKHGQVPMTNEWTRYGKLNKEKSPGAETKDFLHVWVILEGETVQKKTKKRKGGEERTQNKGKGGEVRKKRRDILNSGVWGGVKSQDGSIYGGTKNLKKTSVGTQSKGLVLK